MHAAGGGRDCAKVACVEQAAFSDTIAHATNNHEVLMPAPRDLTGQRFGRLTVISKDGHIFFGAHSRVAWKCICDCGAPYRTTGNALVRGATTSCGCYNIEKSIERFKAIRHLGDEKNRKHGMIGHPIYNTYSSMKSRCLIPRNPAFQDYGGRGITICERWLGKNGSVNFIADMLPTWRPGLSIDRIDNSKGYSPENCRWATDQDQSNNLRTNRIISFNGKAMTMAEWARYVGIGYSCLSTRISRGWSEERALSTKPQKHSRRVRV